MALTLDHVPTWLHDRVPHWTHEHLTGAVDAVYNHLDEDLAGLEPPD